MKKWSRDNSLFPDLNTKKLLLQSRLLDKIIKELQGIPNEGGYHTIPFWWLLHTPGDFVVPLFHSQLCVIFLSTQLSCHS